MDGEVERTRGQAAGAWRASDHHRDDVHLSGVLYIVATLDGSFTL